MDLKNVVLSLVNCQVLPLSCCYIKENTIVALHTVLLPWLQEAKNHLPNCFIFLELPFSSAIDILWLLIRWLGVFHETKLHKGERHLCDLLAPPYYLRLPWVLSSVYWRYDSSTISKVRSCFEIPVRHFILIFPCHQRFLLFFFFIPACDFLSSLAMQIEPAFE